MWSLPATRSALQFTPAAVAAIERASDPLPGKAWTWPAARHRIRHRGSSVVMICDDDGAYWVVASAPTEHALSWLDELDLDDLDVTWDEHDTRHDRDH